MRKGLCLFLFQEGGIIIPPRPWQERRWAMFDFIKKAVFIGAGLASMTAEKIEEAVKEIVNKGDLAEKQGRELLQDLKKRSTKARKELGERIDKIVKDALSRINMPTRRDIEELKARIHPLEV